MDRGEDRQRTATDTLDTTTTSKTADRRLRDALNVITQDLPVTLGTTLAKAFTTLAASRHFNGMYLGGKKYEVMEVVYVDGCFCAG